jgi:hypothetical protein
LSVFDLSFKVLQDTYTVYKFPVPFCPVFKTLLTNCTVIIKERGEAMINVALYSPEKKILECVDIRKAAGTGNE